MQFLALTMLFVFANISFVGLTTEPQVSPSPIENPATPTVIIESVTPK